MPVTRRFVAQNQEECQILKMDSSSRFIVNTVEEWQFLFGPNSILSNSTPIIKIWARFDDDTFNNIKITGYLYDQQNASVTNAGSCTFSIYKVSLPDWTETILTTLSGTQLANYYYYVNPTLSTFTGVDFLGGDTLMIEATAVRLGVTYRDRIYVNHLGIYDNVTRLRQDVDFLDITKQDE
jgi:hypothetical protein